jgi:hypothetical protein
MDAMSRVFEIDPLDISNFNILMQSKIGHLQSEIAVHATTAPAIP